MKVTVCIGSSCHLKGSRQVVEEMKELIAERNMQDQIELAGTFCMGNCQKGVCVMIDEEMYSVSPESTRSFFEEEVMERFQKA